MKRLDILQTEGCCAGKSARTHDAELALLLKGEVPGPRLREGPDGFLWRGARHQLLQLAVHLLDAVWHQSRTQLHTARHRHTSGPSLVCVHLA